jgi:hypothetical protein
VQKSLSNTHSTAKITPNSAMGVHNTGSGAGTSLGITINAGNGHKMKAFS